MIIRCNHKLHNVLRDARLGESAEKKCMQCLYVVETGGGGGGGLAGDNDKVSVNSGSAVIKKKSVQSI